MKVKSESEVAQSCPTLSDPMDCSLTGSSVHGIFQARVLEWGSVNITLICIEKPKSLRDLLYSDICFIAIVWTKSMLSLRNTCILPTPREIFLNTENPLSDSKLNTFWLCIQVFKEIMIRSDQISRSVVSDSSRPHGLQPTRLLRPRNFPGKSTGLANVIQLNFKRIIHHD